VWDGVAAAQAGIVTRRQARTGGLSDEAIDVRLASGRWQRVFPGVLATFSGRLSRAAQHWAAVLAGGADAVLSHETAAELLGLADQIDSRVHVSVPVGRRVTGRPGVVFHRSRQAATARHPAQLPPRTRVEDTVVDLTQTSADLDDALGWLTRAVGSRLTTPERLRTVLGERRRLRWRRELAAALDDVAAGCHSVLELRYLRRVERPHGLPPGTRQHRRGRWYDDVDYVAFGVSVELDGRLAHPSERAFRDHRRDNAAVLIGARVLRYGMADVMRRPCVVAREVAAVLRAAGWTGHPHGCGPDCVAAE
jgi:hypothetical protein